MYVYRKNRKDRCRKIEEINKETVTYSVKIIQKITCQRKPE
jgi:hypothetical protein